MVKILSVGVFVLIAAVLILASNRPDSFRVERSTRIQAPPEKIFPLIEDLQRWRTWSPYERKDPAMQRTLSRVTAGPGAAYAWNGNKDVGQGRMEIVESTPPSRVAIKLDFIKPFEGHDLAEFKLQPAGKATQVSWTLSGPSPYSAKLMGVFIDMDKMIGKDFETGLASLKAAAES